MRLCKHDNYRVIDNIWAPKYSTWQVLINVNKVSDNVEHYLIKFTKAPSMPDWYYISREDITSGGQQPNGAGRVYTPSLSKLQPFTPDNHCEHEIK